MSPMTPVQAYASQSDLAFPNIKVDGASRAPLVDPYGRHINYIRVSVTDRCDFRCVYCMAEDMQ